MKKVFTIVGLFVCLNSFSQSKFIPAVAFSDGSSTEFELVVHSEFINNFNTQMLSWSRSENTLTSGWTAAYCDCEACRSASTENASFQLKIGDTCYTSAHFYANSIKGTGVMKIKIFPTDNPTNFVVGEYRTTGWGVSTNFIENQRLIVYPNPSNSVLNIGFGSGEPYTISIITTDGKVLVNEKVDALTNSMDISAFNQGLYSVKIESAGKVFYSKFIKL